ncbi:MAG: 16S rRNA (guanine(966)-N(2))-methyltransferase RsmD [Campylobacteraceae bacterium]|jgi:16S rRNA (guanine(966)-N(2))-methyltransferase RsmD|nr:16S rRNA (guanine(966)-N(2))-methyltransferase RsmD [Campylobacteraceae bacterium]
MQQNKTLYVNISGGKFRGKKLLLPPLDNTRSTKSILKSSYFNTLQFDIVDAIFVEVFAGSGSMGLEALSRGAKEAYFIEKDKNAFNILKKNCESLEGTKSTCYLGDTFKELPKIAQTLKEPAYFYFDPPFDIRDGMADIYEKTITLLAALPPSKVKLATFEHATSYKMPQTIGDYELIKSKTFGNSSLKFYALKG